MRARGYYVIDTRPDRTQGRRLFAVWLRAAGRPRAVLLGLYERLEEAKVSVPVAWRNAAYRKLEAWGFPLERPEDAGGRRLASAGA